MSDEPSATPPPMDDDGADNEPSSTPPPVDENGAHNDDPATISEDNPGIARETVGGVAPGQGKLSEADDRNMGLLAHILGGVTLIVGPLIIWLVKREESPYLNDQGREAVNFQLTVIIGFVIAGALYPIPIIGCIAGLLFPAISVANLIFAIMGGLEASKGKTYRYPYTLRLIN